MKKLFLGFLAALGVSTLATAGAQTANEKIPRGILPTNVTNEELVLCKYASTIRNTYEIRLALYFAVKDKRRFVLRVPKNTSLEPSVTELISTHGGVVDNKTCDDYSVYISHFDPTGKEMDGWVIGNKMQFQQLQDSIKNHWLKTELKVGTTFQKDSLSKLSDVLKNESISQKNIDDENIGQALSSLIQSCKTQGGFISIQ